MWWTRADRSADQAAGLQQVYGNGALRSPSARVVPATHSDHDVLIVRAHTSPHDDEFVRRGYPLKRSATLMTVL